MSTRFSDQVPTRLGHCCGRRRLKSSTLSKTGDFSPSLSRSLHPAAPLSAADFIATGARATPLPRYWRRRFCLPPARPPRLGPDTGILPWPLTGSGAATLPPGCRQQPQKQPHSLTAGQRRFSIPFMRPLPDTGSVLGTGPEKPGPMGRTMSLWMGGTFEARVRPPATELRAPGGGRRGRHHRDCGRQPRRKRSGPG